MIDNKFIEDMTKLASSGFMNMAAITKDFEASIKERLENYFKNMNLVTREEFDLLKAMLAEIMIRQEEINKKIEEISNKK